MAFNTPMYQPYTPARDNAEANWGAATPAGGNTGYDANIRDQAFSKIASEYGGNEQQTNWGQENS